MQRVLLLIIFFILQVCFLSINSTDTGASTDSSNSYELYVNMQLDGIVNYDVFNNAITGYNKIDSRKKDMITIIDFTKPSTEERLYVLDIKQRKLLFSSYVSHGRNSGENYATSFSNKNGSFQSSLGFYVTGSTYYGKNGYSLILNGLEKNINDRAKERAIVIHGAPYSNPSVINSLGRLGRSLGCPALPEALSKPIINTIKDGSVIFIYADDKNYLTHSYFLLNSKSL